MKGMSHVQAFERDSGRALWTRKFKLAFDTSPLVGETLVFLRAGQQAVLALYAESGETCWTKQAERRFTSAPGLAGGRVYVGIRQLSTKPHALLALDAATGGELGKPLAGESAFSITPTPLGPLLLCGSGDGKLYALDATDGSVRWQIDCGGEMHPTLAVSGDHVLSAARDGMVLSIRWRPEATGLLSAEKHEQEGEWEKAAVAAALQESDYRRAARDLEQAGMLPQALALWRHAEDWPQALRVAEALGRESELMDLAEKAGALRTQARLLLEKLQFAQAEPLARLAGDEQLVAVALAGQGHWAEAGPKLLALANAQERDEGRTSEPVAPLYQWAALCFAKAGDPATAALCQRRVAEYLALPWLEGVVAGQEDLVEGGEFSLTLQLTNAGSGDAQNVQLELRESRRFVLVDTDPPRSCAAANSLPLRFSIRPLAFGKFPLSLRVHYSDGSGARYYRDISAEVLVLSKQQPLMYRGVYIESHGPVIAPGGDVVLGSKDSVSIVRGPSPALGRPVPAIDVVHGDETSLTIQHRSGAVSGHSGAPPVPGAGVCCPRCRLADLDAQGTCPNCGHTR
jgi:hypothetical protein